ncbi:MAG TPA: SMC family ATPase [Ktedonobacteraceae bacterium]|nr:SMC family ATPase [Ktedonobacteraceae bacterium]
MLPLRLSLEGFLSYREKQTIDFTGSSLWMLWGPNGVGKSAIFDAITFALYNTHRAVDGNSYNLAYLINHRSDKLIVVFDFIMNGEIYRIRRTCTRGRGRTINVTREAFLLQGDDLSNLEQMPAKPIPMTDNETDFKNWVHQTIGLNYEAFASSVLLLQGKSERLLEAKTEQRYKTLAELIDLSFYKKIHMLADRQRLQAKGAMDSLTKQFQGMAPVTDEALALAQTVADEKSTDLTKAQQQVEHLTALHPQAGLWEDEMAQMKTQQEQLQETLKLLQRSKEIKKQFSRFTLLNQIIPDLERVLSQREQLEQKAREIPALERELAQKQQDFSTVIARRDNLKTQMNNIASILSDLIRRKDQAQSRLLELSPLVNDLQQMEKLQRDLENIKADLNQIPVNFTQQLAECEQQSAQLDEKVQVLPWLQSFAQARIELASDLKREQAVSSERETLNVQSQQLRERQEQNQQALLIADQEERESREQKTRADQKLKEARQRLKKFSEASAQPVCSLCGQKISPEHAQAESQHLQNEIATAKAALDQLDISYNEVCVTQRRLKSECTTLTDQLAELTVAIQNQKISQQAVQTRIEQHAKSIRIAFTNMNASFQQAICATAPVQDQDWLVTQYPTQAELEALQLEVSRQRIQKKRLEELRAQHQSIQKLLNNQTFVEGQLEELLATIDLEAAKNARVERQKISENRETLTLEITQQQEEQKQKKLCAQEVEKTYGKLDASLQEGRTQLTTAKTARDTLDETLRQMISVLSPDWQEVATSLSADSLHLLEQERDELVPYEDLHQQLTLADHTREIQEQRIQELQGSLQKIPCEAQRPQIAVQQDLEQSKAHRKQIEQESGTARSHLADMKRQQAYYLDIEQQKKDVERQHRLYGLLTDLLGGKGLQLHLLRRAERTIIDLANKTLAGLSHHRLRLELRGESDNTAQAEKALDLVVYDYDTGQHAMLVSQVSGSQRFRIAVSLALAIGRYTRQEIRPIKSVIIDEGFGSLDKTGRDDMIRELTALGQELELERIILVSHQDEFAAAFPNRYSFSLVDNASHVKLFSED